MELWLWEEKYPAFAALGKWARKEYWKEVHGAHEQIYKGAAATVEDGDAARVQQLVAQTDKVRSPGEQGAASGSVDGDDDDNNNILHTHTHM